MPEAIQIGGKTVYRPGVYGQIDASALGGKQIATGNLAIVGAFPFAQNDVPVECISPAALAALDPGNLDLQQIAKLAFTPSRQDGIGGANKVFLLNVQTCTQAAYTALDNAGAGSLTLKSKVWGQKGNQTYVKLNTNAGTAAAIDVQLRRGPLSETYTGLQSGVVVEVANASTDLSGGSDTVLLTASPTTFSLAWAKRLAALVGAFPARALTFTNTDLRIDGQLVCSLSVAPVNDILVTVVGVNKAGVPKTLTGTIAGGGTGPITIQDGGSPAEWASLTSVKYETTNAADDAFAGVLTISSTAFALTPSDFATIKDIADYVNNASALGWSMVAKSPKIGSIPATEIDIQTSVSIKSPAKASLRADLWAIVQALTPSAIVTPSRASNANKPPKHAGAGPATSETAFLLGGTVSSVVTADWTAALVELESEDVQIVWGDTESATIGGELVAHCSNAALAGRERNAWMGATAQQSATQLLDGWAALLNSRNIAVCSHEIYVATPAGASAWLAPKYGALQLAAMQAGTPVATPLTFKRPDVLDARAAWKPGFATDNDIISKGICALTRDDLGWKVLRSVTTYLTDDNPAFSEVSANESLNASVRRLRGAMEGKIGNPLLGVTAKQFTAAAADELDAQVRDGVIKAWRNLSLVDVGAGFDVHYEAAPVESINFVQLFLGAYRTGG